MPTHGYVSGSTPPTRFDHILAHCFELAISGWAMLAGLAAIFSAFNEQATVSPSLDRLPGALAGVAGLLLLSGGAEIIRGLFDGSDDLMVGFRRETMGLVLFGGGWLSYGVCIAALSVTSIMSWSLCAFMVAGSVLRIVAIRRTETRLREAIQ